MSKYEIGKVAPTYKGSYETNTSYNELDIVEFNGSSYIARQSVTGVTPGTDDASWGLIANQGLKGDKGDKGPKGDTGTVDVDKSYTWTSPQTFSHPIIGGISAQELPVPLSTVLTNVSAYTGNWYFGTDETSGGSANGYPIEDNGIWYMEVSSFTSNRGFIKLIYNYSNRIFYGSIRNNDLISWVEVTNAMEENNVFNSDITVNGNIKANSITSTSGGFTIKTDYMGDY